MIPQRRAALIDYALAAAPAPKPDAPRIIPRGIFVARRTHFSCTSIGAKDASDVLTLLFAQLPLEAHGWRRETIRIRRVRDDALGTLWALERTP